MYVAVVTEVDKTYQCLKWIFENTLKCTYLFVFTYLEAWRKFISQYSITHNDLLDLELCQSCFKDDLFTPSDPESTTESSKREEKRKTVKPPSVLFTGLSTVLVKKYMQVRHQ